MEILKLNGCEFYPREIANAYTDGKIYLIKPRAIYQIFYSNAQKRFCTQKIYTHTGNLPLVSRGRFILANGKRVNDILNFKLVND